MTLTQCEDCGTALPDPDTDPDAIRTDGGATEVQCTDCGTVYRLD